MMTEAIKKASQNVPTVFELNEFETLIAKDSLSPEDDAKLFYLNEKIQSARIHAYNLNDFRYALEAAGASKQQVEFLVSHENAHANKAVQLGAQFEDYYFTIYSESNGELDLDVGATISIPEKGRTWTNEKRKETDIQITRAPDEYGNKMSEDDKKRLDQLDEWYPSRK